MTATVAEPVAGAIAYSPDGSAALVRGAGSSTLCVVSVGKAQSSAGRVCPTVNGRVTSAVFSPDGKTIAVADDGAVDLKGGLWLITAKDGTVRKVPTPPTSAQSKHKNALYRTVVWPVGRSPIALVTMPEATGLVEHLASVDISSAKPTDLGAAAPAGTYANAAIAVGGHTVLLGVSTTSGSDARLVTFDLDSKKSTSLPGDRTSARKGWQVLPLAVSGDGKRAVALWSNPATFHADPLSQVDLHTGAVITVPGMAGVLAVGAAFSPDSSQVAILADDAKSHAARLLVAPVDGGAARSLATLKSVSAQTVGLDWTRGGVVVPHVGAGGSELKDLAPISLGN